MSVTMSTARTVAWRTGTAAMLAVVVLTGGGPAAALPAVVWRVALLALALGVAVLLAVGISAATIRAAGMPALLSATFVVCAAASSVSSAFRLEALTQTGVTALMLLLVTLTATTRWDGARSANARAALRGDMSTVVVSLAASVVLAALLGALRIPWAIGPYDRLVGTFSNANYLGMVAALAAIGALALAAERATGRSVWLGVAASCLPALAWSGSRGAVAGCAVGAIAILIVKRWWKSLTILGLAAVVGGIALFPLVAARLQGSDLSSGRFAAYAAALRLWSQSPILGVGYRTLELQPTMGGLGAHNILIAVLAETGIVGVAVFVALIATLFWRGGSGVWLGPALAVLVIEQTESSMLGWAGPTALAMWWILFAYAASGRRARARDRGRPATSEAAAA